MEGHQRVRAEEHIWSFEYILPVFSKNICLYPGGICFDNSYPQNRYHWDMTSYKMETDEMLLCSLLLLHASNNSTSHLGSFFLFLLPLLRTGGHSSKQPWNAANHPYESQGIIWNWWCYQRPRHIFAARQLPVFWTHRKPGAMTKCL